MVVRTLSLVQIVAEPEVDELMAPGAPLNSPSLLLVFVSPLRPEMSRLRVSSVRSRMSPSSVSTSRITSSTDKAWGMDFN